VAAEMDVPTEVKLTYTSILTGIHENLLLIYFV
jgi:hypothetical protein